MTFAIKNLFKLNLKPLHKFVFWSNRSKVFIRSNNLFEPVWKPYFMVNEALSKRSFALQWEMIKDWIMLTIQVPRLYHLCYFILKQSMYWKEKEIKQESSLLPNQECVQEKCWFFFKEFWSFCHLYLNSTGLLLVFLKIGSQ